MNMPTMVVGIFYNKEEMYAMINNLKRKDFDGNQKEDIATGDHLGYFYVLDCGDRVKIGSTMNPIRRYKELYNFLCSYGALDVTTMYISKVGTNYFENENTLHKLFNSYQLNNTEMYKISVSVVLSKAKDLAINDESKKLIERDRQTAKNIEEFTDEMFGISDLKAMDLSSKNKIDKEQNFIDCVNEDTDYPKRLMADLIELNKKQSENNLLLTSNLNNNDYWINEEIIKEQYYDKPITLHKFIKIFSSCRKANVGYKRLTKYLRKYNFITYKSLDNKESYLAPTKESINRELFKMADLVKNNIKYKQLLITAEGQDLLDDVLSQNMDKLMSPDL